MVVCLSMGLWFEGWLDLVHVDYGEKFECGLLYMERWWTAKEYSWSFFFHSFLIF